LITPERLEMLRKGFSYKEGKGIELVPRQVGLELIDEIERLRSELEECRREWDDLKLFYYNNP